MTIRLLCAVFLTALSCWAQTPAGRWDGTIAFGALKFPFTIYFEGTGNSLSGSFVNGDSHVASTSGSFEGGLVRLAFERLGTHLEAKLSEGSLNGSYGSKQLGTHPLAAAAYCTCALEGEAGPEIMGVWELSEAGWRLVIERKGEDTLATVSRPDGELGPLTGRFDGATFMLRYFDGTRAAVVEIEQSRNHGLDITRKEPASGIKKYKAVRLRREK